MPICLFPMPASVTRARKQVARYSPAATTRSPKKAKQRRDDINVHLYRRCYQVCIFWKAPDKNGVVHSLGSDLVVSACRLDELPSFMNEAQARIERRAEAAGVLGTVVCWAKAPM